MNQDLEHKFIDAGELRLEVLAEDESDDDKRFRASVKNLLILIKDYYGADSAAFYWFNVYKKQHKLLTSSELIDEDAYISRYDTGEDILTQSCLKKEPSIIKTGYDNDRLRLAYRTDVSDVKSILVYPVLIEQEVVGCIICESKTNDFFDIPNVKTLSVFSESIASYIKYYSTYEEFYFQDKILKSLASGKLAEENAVNLLIENIITRFIDIKNLRLVHPESSGFKVLKNPGSNLEGRIDESSLTAQAINNKKIVVYDFKADVINEFRFFKDENIERDSVFTVMPVFAGKKCLGALCIDTINVLSLNEVFFAKIYKLVVPVFLYLFELKRKINISEDLYDECTDFYNTKYFDICLNSEIIRCRHFNENNLFIIYLYADELTVETDKNLITQVFGFIKEYFSGYDRLFKIGNEKLAMLINMESSEKIFLNFEKLRKEISTKIIKINEKEFNPTISVVIKRFDIQSDTKDIIFSDMNKMLELCEKEGGNTVKI